jgi:hypothetical protein
MPGAEFNLGAYGVAFALAILIEAPVIMLMSAATSLVRDRISYLKMRNFSRGLILGTTLLLLIVLVPGVYRWLTETLLQLPAEVADLTYGALWFFLPWPSAIGYRRFLQGVLIRAGKTRLVAVGTLIRLLAMTVAALLGYLLLDIPGAWVGGLALGTGVTVEAIAARFMAAETVRDLLAEEGNSAYTGRTVTYRAIATFYLPLALTSLIGLTIQPLLTFFMGRSVSPVESLAIYPVVHSLSFFFRSVGFAYQDAAIALIGERFEHYRELRRFCFTLGAVTTAGLALVAFTPLFQLWFTVLSGLTPELTSFALIPARIIVPLPFLSVLLSFQRAILVEGRRTQHITWASVIEVTTVAVLFLTLGFGFEVVGATAAFTAFLGGRLLSTVYLVPGCASVLRESLRGSA